MNYHGLGWNKGKGLGWNRPAKPLDAKPDPGDTKALRTEGNSRMDRLVKVKTKTGDIEIDFDELVAKDPSVAEHVYELLGDDDPDDEHLQQYADLFVMKFQLEHLQSPV